MSDSLHDQIKLNSDEENLKIIEMIKDKNLYQPEFIWPHGETMIHWCAAHNNYKLLEYILSNNLLHVNLMNYRSTPAIYYAAINNNKEAIGILIKYHANTSMRSGFSGQLPISQLKDLECKKLIIEHEKKFLPIVYYDMNSIMNPKEPTKKINFTHYQTILFRIYMYFNSCLFSNLNPYKHTFEAPEFTKQLKELYQKEGLIGISKLCEQKLKTYVESLSSNVEICAAGHKKDNLLTCSKCKQAKFCNRDCQKVVFKFHKFDCKKL